MQYVGGAADIRVAYRASMDRLVAERLPIAWAVFLSVNGVASLFEWQFYPERAAALLQGTVVYTLLCIVTLGLTRWRPSWAVGCATVASNVLALATCRYYAIFGANADVLLVCLVLILTGVALIYPLGARRQLWQSVGAVVGYPLALWAGAEPVMPALYGLFFLGVGVAMVTLGAQLVDGHRFTAYAHAHASQEANRAKSEFLSTVSHELRTPLNVIMGYTSLLLDDALPPAQGRDALRRVHQQSMQLLDLIQAMLDLNKVEAGGVAVKVEEFHLGELLDGLRTGLPAVWRKPGVELEWVAPAPQARLRTDRGKLEMIVRNLVHNALKFTEDGQVVVTADILREPGRVLFTIADTGPGIDARELASLFDMFRQGARGVDGTGGVGLGLYIVKRFTDALGGEVRVESQPGDGSRFTVAVPLETSAGLARASV